MRLFAKYKHLNNELCDILYSKCRSSLNKTVLRAWRASIVMEKDRSLLCVNLRVYEPNYYTAIVDFVWEEKENSLNKSKMSRHYTARLFIGLFFVVLGSFQYCEHFVKGEYFEVLRAFGVLTSITRKPNTSCASHIERFIHKVRKIIILS